MSKRALFIEHDHVSLGGPIWRAFEARGQRRGDPRPLRAGTGRHQPRAVHRQHRPEEEFVGM